MSAAARALSSRAPSRASFARAPRGRARGPASAVVVPRASSDDGGASAFDFSTLAKRVDRLKREEASGATGTMQVIVLDATLPGQRLGLRFDAKDTKRRLNAVLQSEGILIENVLLGEHKFNATYEQTIRDKKVAEQEAARLTSETRAAFEEMARDLERAKGDVGKQVEEARGEAEKRRLEADAIYFERERQAQASLAEKQALAEGLTERARAMSGAGGEAMVKLKIAEALKGKKIVFIPAGSGMDLRNTDVNQLLEVYGAKSLAK